MENTPIGARMRTFSARRRQAASRFLKARRFVYSRGTQASRQHYGQHDSEQRDEQHLLQETRSGLMHLLHLRNPTRTLSREEHLNRYLWALLAVTNLVDLLASRRAFALGIDELNPIVDALFSAYGIGSIAIFKLFWLIILLVLIPHIRGWTQAFFAFACLIYLGLTALHIARLSPLL